MSTQIPAEDQTMTTPQKFDINAWLDGVDRPARSVVVYQKAGLLADMDVLAEKIRNADTDEVDGPAIGGGVGELRAAYADLARRFHESSLVVRVQSVTNQEQVELLKGHEDLDQHERGAIVMAEAIVEPKMTPEQVRRLNKVIGDAQFSLIVRAWDKACEDAPVVSADFLPKRSTPDDGGE